MLNISNKKNSIEYLDNKNIFSIVTIILEEAFMKRSLLKIKC